MEIEFVYRVAVTDEQHQQLDAAAQRAVTLNRHITGYQLADPIDGYTVLAIRSGGHDRTQISRRFVAPIRSIFTKAKIPAQKVQLVSSLLVPNGRSLTLDTGRTPQGTFTDPALRQMLRDYGATLHQEPATDEATGS